MSCEVEILKVQQEWEECICNYSGEKEGGGPPMRRGEGIRRYSFIGVGVCLHTIALIYLADTTGADLHSSLSLCDMRGRWLQAYKPAPPL